MRPAVCCKIRLQRLRTSNLEGVVRCARKGVERMIPAMEMQAVQDETPPRESAAPSRTGFTVQRESNHGECKSVVRERDV
mmetsp:Transcript_30888/g.62294  ORF Transcript_30888/g.62294 Transcript_30888/m.62294 type:complete len:80 (-) Transcript_30888:338-577(-)